MKIDFFETGSGMDPHAAKGGTYMIQLLNLKTATEPICLYIGESVWIASRCGVHLYSLFEDAGYFGLTEDDLKNEDLILKFSVVEAIDGKKSILGRGKYLEKELDAIKMRKPLTQLETSDRQIRDVQARISRVQNEMKNRGFK